MTKDVQELRDRSAIIDLYSSFAAALDELDGAALAKLFVIEAVVSGWDDEPWAGRTRSVEKLLEINASHGSSHRMVTNHLIQLDGDRARATALYRSAHLDAAPEPGQYGTTHSHEGWYRTELVRSGKGWLIARLEHSTLADSLQRKSK